MSITDRRSPRITIPVRLILYVLTNLIVLCGLHAQEDGVYKSSPGNGPAIRLKVISGSIQSLDNGNEAFAANVCIDPDGRPSGTVYYLVLDGKRKPRSGSGMSGDNPTFSLNRLTPREAASASALFGLPLQLRKHPGHRIDATFATDKPAYEPGEPITVTVTIRNLGDEPIFLEFGHNGPKDTMFSFAAASIPLCNPEVTKQYVGGGITIIATLPAHGEISSTAKFDEWFETRIPGRYYILGSYLLEMFKDRDDDTHSPIWIDYATRLFVFDIKKSK